MKDEFTRMWRDAFRTGGGQASQIGPAGGTGISGPWSTTTIDYEKARADMEAMRIGIYEREAKEAAAKATAERAAERAVARKNKFDAMVQRIFENLYCQPAMMIHTVDERYAIAVEQTEAFFKKAGL